MTAFLLRSPLGRYLAADAKPGDFPLSTTKLPAEAARFLCREIIEDYWPNLLDAGWTVEGTEA